MNEFLSAIPLGGLILCARKDETVARYALEGLPNKVLTSKHRRVLPNEKELEAEIKQTQAMIEERKRIVRRPLVACRTAVYDALVAASLFIPKNGPDNRKQSLVRANAAKFIERLCPYPGNPTDVKEAQRHILKAHAERLTEETGKKATGFPQLVTQGVR